MFDSDSVGMLEEERHAGEIDPISQGISSAIALIEGEISRHQLAATQSAATMESWQQGSNFVTDGIETWDIGALQVLLIDLYAQLKGEGLLGRDSLRRLRNLFQELHKFVEQQRAQHDYCNPISAIAWKRSSELFEAAIKAAQIELGAEEVAKIRPALRRAFSDRFSPTPSKMQG